MFKAGDTVILDYGDSWDGLICKYLKQDPEYPDTSSLEILAKPIVWNNGYRIGSIININNKEFSLCRPKETPTYQQLLDKL